MARVSFHATGGAAGYDVFPHIRSPERAWLTASRNSWRIESIPGIPVPGLPGGGADGETVPESPPPQPHRDASTTAIRNRETHFMRISAACTGYPRNHQYR